jgi:hypothetical protein
MDAEAPTADIGAVIVTPGEILAEMNAVDAAVRELDAQVNAVAVPTAFKQAWRAFAEEWRKFHEEHQALSQRIWTEVYRQTLAYRRRVEEWFAAFAREGWRMHPTTKSDAAADASPALPPPVAPMPAPPGYGLGTLALVAAGAALLSGLLVHESKE